MNSHKLTLFEKSMLAMILILLFGAMFFTNKNIMKHDKERKEEASNVVVNELIVNGPIIEKKSISQTIEVADESYILKNDSILRNLVDLAISNGYNPQTMIGFDENCDYNRYCKAVELRIDELKISKKTSSPTNLIKEFYLQKVQEQAKLLLNSSKAEEASRIQNI